MQQGVLRARSASAEKLRIFGLRGKRKALPWSFPGRDAIRSDCNDTLRDSLRHKRKKRAPARERVRLEHQAQTQARAEGLLEKIIVHSGSCIRSFEVVGIADSKTLIGVLVDQSLGFSVGD